MFQTLNALVLREVRYREADRILTVLTEQRGKQTMTAHGALSRRSKMAAATQQLTYSELTVFEKNNRLSVREGSVREAFAGLRKDIRKLALGSYFAECLEIFAGEDQPEPELLQLGLNCLYALSEDLYPEEKIKLAFEFRLAAATGYAPEIDRCPVCGREEIREPVFLSEEGRVVCRACRKAGHAFSLYGEMLPALRILMHAPAKKILAFSLNPEETKALGIPAETWLLRCAGKSIPTLQYYTGLH